MDALFSTLVSMGGEKATVAFYGVNLKKKEYKVVAIGCDNPHLGSDKDVITQMISAPITIAYVHVTQHVLWHISWLIWRG